MCAWACGGPFTFCYTFKNALQLYDLPFDMLEMIGEFYDLAQREEGCTRPTVLNLADSLEFGPSTARLSAGAPFAGPPLYAWTHA
jgi:hypothetical protein